MDVDDGAGEGDPVPAVGEVAAPGAMQAATTTAAAARSDAVAGRRPRQPVVLLLMRDRASSQAATGGSAAATNSTTRTISVRTRTATPSSSRGDGPMASSIPRRKPPGFRIRTVDMTGMNTTSTTPIAAISLEATSPEASSPVEPSAADVPRPALADILRALGDPGYAPAGDARAAYETHGIGLARHVARRLAKTRLLDPMRDLLDPRAPRPAEALAIFGLYAAAAMTSWGRGYRQPTFDRAGALAEELDPETSAPIAARLAARGGPGRGRPGPIRLSGEVRVPGIGMVTVDEEIRGTTAGIHGLGMPAPSRIVFVADGSLGSEGSSEGTGAPDRGGSPGPFGAEAIGVLTTELAPRPFGWIVRGHGSLALSDSAGDEGLLRLGRDGWADLEVRSADGRTLVLRRRVF